MNVSCYMLRSDCLPAHSPLRMSVAQVNYQEVGEQVTIARPSEALHKLRALVAAIRVVETYGEGWGKGRGGEGRGGEGRGRDGFCIRRAVAVVIECGAELLAFPPLPPRPHLSVPLSVSIDLTHELTQVLLQQTQPTDSRGGTTIAMLYANW